MYIPLIFSLCVSSLSGVLRGFSGGHAKLRGAQPNEKYPPPHTHRQPQMYTKLPKIRSEALLV